MLLSDPAKIYYVREIVRYIGEEINAVRRILGQMDNKSMVFKEKRGNRLYYGFNKDYLYYNELLQLVAKSTGLGKVIIKERNRVGKIKYCLLAGKFVRHKPHTENDVDLLIIGNVVMPQLSALVSAYEQRTEREINYSVMTKDEFEFRKKRRDPFIYQILMSSRVMLIGDEEELVG